MSSNKYLKQTEIESILKILRSRFEIHKERFEELNWSDIQTKLEQNLNKLWSLNEMEKTGGEPNLLEFDSDTKEYVFCDFSKESPSKRRSLCYDREALESRKKHKPVSSAIDFASDPDRFHNFFQIFIGLLVGYNWKNFVCSFCRMFPIFFDNFLGRIQQRNFYRLLRFFSFGINPVFAIHSFYKFIYCQLFEFNICQARIARK